MTATPPNRLAREKSPYLLQHQHNPVDWYPWGEEAFAKARAEQKPIFLSIGYSTCHWCHVMAHESFESAEVATFLNEHFVSIKVDREERPDVDRVYMTYVQATTGGGGWPMTVFLTPDLQPFYGGTYFPPQDRYGRPGFLTLLQGISGAWEKDRANVVKSGAEAVAQLRAHTAPSVARGKAGRAQIDAALDQLAQNFDDEWGGFGNAPKFPHPVSLNLLFRSTKKGAREMAIATLDKMAAGGMHDHLGGGFHRYSVDRYWHIPHFEKMLYDQALLACSYLDAYQITQAPRHAATVRDILDYVLRDLSDPGGGFYSAEDADSLLAHGKPEHAEGAFYVWTADEIAEVLGPERAEVFNRTYGVEPTGNSPRGSDPHGEFVGKNTLIVRHPEEAATLAEARALLFQRREKRPRPHRDDKIITAWNGLMISAFARAGAVLGEARYVQAAQRSAAFLRASLWKNGRLLRSFRGEASHVAGFADDYAFLIQGLLDLYEADFDVAWLQWAAELQGVMDREFYDAEHGGYFSVGEKAPDILLRLKEDYDGAEPSPNSVAARNLLRLAQITASTDLRAKAEKTINAFADRLAAAPTALPQMLCALNDSLRPPRQIVIAGSPARAETQALLAEVRRRYLPGTLLLLADGRLAQHLESIAGMTPVNGQPAVYICENFACQLPVTDASQLGELLDR